MFAKRFIFGVVVRLVGQGGEKKKKKKGRRTLWFSIGEGGQTPACAIRHKRDMFKGRRTRLGKRAKGKKGGGKRKKIFCWTIFCLVDCRASRDGRGGKGKGKKRGYLRRRTR